MEEHLDAAFAAGGEVASALVRARMSHGLSAVVGQPAFAAFGQANLTITEARGHAVKGHRLLEHLARSLDIDISMYGDTRKDDGDDLVGGASTGG